MVKIACSNKNDVEAVDSNNIILIKELMPFITNKTYSGFPPLSKDIYKWSLKNKCRYTKVHYVGPKSTQLEWALLFNNAESCEKFRKHWLQTVVMLDKPWTEYEFSLDNSWTWPWNQKMSKEAAAWMKENKIRTVKRNGYWLRFRTASQAMAFKLRWL